MRVAAWMMFGLMVVCFGAGVVDSQTGAGYRFDVAVDEVNLTFHAADAAGLPVNDLKVEELGLLDNGLPPQKILDFRLMKDYPIRAGILMDTSESMEGELVRDRGIAMVYAKKMLRQGSDRAFVMDFGYVSKVQQDWTSDPGALVEGIFQVVAGRENPLAGTAMLDAVERACLYEFGEVDNAASGNFVLLFSDGEDNRSHAEVKDVVDACQKSNTAVYAFRAETKAGSAGSRTLQEMADETGGRVFPADESEAAVDGDLRLIEAELRNQYRLIYRPAVVKHDGKFHRIEMRIPERVESVSIRSGYYAPGH